MYLDKIYKPSDVKSFNYEELSMLAGEIREALLNRLSKYGGHLSSNMGIVEATIAIHYVFDSPKDKIIFDVSHQSYPHKMLTGRAFGYIDDNRFEEITGYSNPEESEHDHFIIGHTSTSISLATGLAKGRDIVGGNDNIIAVIGDGSLSGGQALEGLNTAGDMDTNLVIVVNDNEQSIAENHGGLYKNLRLLRQSQGKTDNNIFKAIGLDYIYLEEGNNIKKLVEVFSKVKDIDHPIVVHIHTCKGLGYSPAMVDKERWHWCMPFNIETGESAVNIDNDDYSTITRNFILDKMKKDDSVVLVTAAVPSAVGFDKESREIAGKQYVDVGIAEEQAVAMCSGLAKNGAKPIFATNATFIQRTYDQIFQDVCLNRSPVTFLLNCSSFYGLTDVTHTGMYAMSMLVNIPGLVYLAPTNVDEYLTMLEWSIDQTEYPVAIGIPGIGLFHSDYNIDNNYGDITTFQVCEKGSRVAIIALGDMFWLGKQTWKLLNDSFEDNVTLINPRYGSGVDDNCLENLKKDHSVVVTLEGGILEGGFGHKIAAYYSNSHVKVINYGFQKDFYDGYDPGIIMIKNRMTPKRIKKDVMNVLSMD